MENKDLIEVDLFRTCKKVTVRCHNTPKALIGMGNITENDFVEVRSDFDVNIATRRGKSALFLHGVSDCGEGVIEGSYTFKTHWEALRFVEESQKLIGKYNDKVLSENTEYYLRLKGLGKCSGYINFDIDCDDVFLSDNHSEIGVDTKFTRDEINELKDKFPDFPWDYITTEEVK